MRRQQRDGRPAGGGGRSRTGESVAISDERAAPPGQLTDEVLSTLYDLYAKPLFAFALRLSGDRERSEEVVQNALLSAWQHPESVDASLGSARAWLYTVVRNSLTDSWRRDAARPHTSSPERLETLAVPDEVERAVESWGLADAMRKLSAEHRQVLRHSFYLGHSVEETASDLHIPPGTVKSRTYYALRSLHVALEEMGYLR